MSGVTQCVAFGCATAVTISALLMGYDGQLALIAIVGLFGGEKLLAKLLK